MGYALYLVWIEEDASDKEIAFWAFGVQLGLNVLWSIIFFGLQNPGMALAEIWILWLAIVFNIFAFWKISRTAGWFLVPHLSWVTFAIFLNYSIWKLN